MTEPDLLIAGRYRLVEALAAGGMGVVWRGWDETLQRPVAVKQLRLPPGLSPDEAATARTRAMREAQITARLHHEHAVPVYDVVDHHGQPCLIMQFLPSESLQDRIRRTGALPPVEVAAIGRDVADALTAAHATGVVHRDVKPGNVLLGQDGNTKLTDFGISQVLGDATLTTVGMVTGTPGYLAPEVARGAKASFAADVFSLGSTLYTAVEGHPPFGGADNAMATLHRVASVDFAPPAQAGALTPLLMRMMQADPDTRPSMREVQHTLAALHDDSATLRAGRAQDRQPTTVMAAVPAQSPPPTARVPLPPVAPARRPTQPGPARRRLPAVAVIVLLALLVGVAAYYLTSVGRHGSGTAAGTSKAAPPASAGTGSPAGTGSSGVRASAVPPSSTPSSATASPPTSASAAASGASAAQLASTITRYYSLIPGDLQQGWAALTPSYRQAHAGGFAAYRDFWSQIRQVSVSDATGQPPSSVTATVTYRYRSGRTVVEETRFQLVSDHGSWKIDDTSVLSSRSG